MLPAKFILSYLKLLGFLYYESIYHFGNYLFTNTLSCFFGDSKLSKGISKLLLVPECDTFHKKNYPELKKKQYYRERKHGRDHFRLNAVLTWLEPDLKRNKDILIWSNVDSIRKLMLILLSIITVL